jgi:hypothetical protein
MPPLYYYHFSCWTCLFPCGLFYRYWGLREIKKVSAKKHQQMTTGLLDDASLMTLVALKVDISFISFVLSAVSNIISLFFVSAVEYYLLIIFLACLFFATKHHLSPEPAIKAHQHFLKFYIPFTVLLVGETAVQQLLAYLAQRNWHRNTANNVTYFIQTLQNMKIYQALKCPTQIEKMEWDSDEKEEFDEILKQADLAKRELFLCLEDLLPGFSENIDLKMH